MCIDIDYFETPEMIPADVQTILDKHFGDRSDLDYPELAACVEELETIGWTFDFYLDAVPFGLMPVQ